MKKVSSISVFGDSILRGIVLNSTKRYAVSDSIGIDSIGSLYSMQVTNLSRFGCTTPRGYEYIRKYLERGGHADVVLLELGGNDCDFNWNQVAADPFAEHQPNTPLDIFVETYHRIIDCLKEHGVIPVLTNLPPVCPERYLDWICRDGLDREKILEFLGSSSTIYRYQENYSRTIEQIASQSGSFCIDLRGAFLKHRLIDDLYCEDGIHPNDKGQGIIRDTLIETINKTKGVIYA